jgi:hypothetical protein
MKEDAMFGHFGRIGRRSRGAYMLLRSCLFLDKADFSNRQSWLVDAPEIQTASRQVV